MGNRLVFVSCGQLTQEEKALGKRIKTAIDETPGFEAYYAEDVQDLAGLAEHVFDALRRCSCAIVVLHSRGSVHREDKKKTICSSVWINQEIAVLAYRRFFESRRIPVLAFMDPQVSLEGAMSALILNPRPITDADSMLSEIGAWLGGQAFDGPVNEDVVFQEKWEALRREEKLILQALIEEGGIRVKETSIQGRLRRQLGDNDVRLAFLEGRSNLTARGLVEITQNVYSGNEMSLHPTWEWYVRYAARKMERDS